jgi:hypothetical protein
MFKKTLAKYYLTWFYDSCDSITYCKEHGDSVRAAQYLQHAQDYLTIIMENWEAIQFFSVDDRAFKIDSALPVEFRGYL